MALGRLSVVLDANIAKFESDMGRAARVAQQQSAAMQRSFENAAKRIATVLGGAFAIGKMTEFVKSSIDLADNLNLMSQKVGIGAGALSALKLEADRNGASFDMLSDGINKFAKSAGAAAYSATSQQAQAFNALGISVTDAGGKLRNTQDLLVQAANKLSGYRDGMAKTVIAQQLFGKSGAQLIPMLNALGRDGIAKVTEDAKALGVYIGDDAAKAATRFNDGVTALKAALSGLAITAANELLPALQSTVDKLTDFIKTAREDGTVKKFADAIGFIVDHLKEIFEFIVARAVLVRVVAGIASIGTAASTASVAVGVLRGALLLLGGPIGLIATAVAGSLMLLQEYNARFDTFSRTVANANTQLDKFLGLSGAAQFRQSTALALSVQQDNESLKDLQGEIAKTQKLRDAAAKDAFTGTWSAAGEASRGQLAAVDGQLKKLKAQQAELTAVRDKSQKVLDQYRKDLADPHSALHAGQTRTPDAPTLTNPKTGDNTAKLKALASAYDALAAAAQKANEKQLTPQGKALADYTNGVRELAKLAGDYVAKGGDVAKIQDLILQGKAGLWQQYTRAVQAAAAADKEFSDGLKHQLDLQKQAIDIEVASIGMGAKQADRLRQRNALEQQGADAIRQLTLERDKYLSTDPQYQVLTQHIKEQAETNKKALQQQADGFGRSDAAMSNWHNGFTSALDDFSDRMNNVAQQMKDFTNQFIDGFGNAFVQFAMGTQSASKAFGSFVDQMLANALRWVADKAMQKLLDWAGGSGGSSGNSGSGWGGLVSAFAGLFGGGKASGGAVAAGGMYQVNERGPELLSVGGRDFLMMGSQGGTVTPNSRLGGGSQVINVNVQPTSSQRTASQIAQAVARKQQLAMARA